MNPNQEAAGSPLVSFLIFLVPVVLFLLLLWRLSKKTHGHVDRAMEVGQASLEAQRETNRLLQRLIDLQEGGR